MAPTPSLFPVLHHWLDGTPTPAERAALLRRADPAAAEALVAAAGALLAGRQVLPGTRGRAVDLGAVPAWHVNPTDDKEFTWSLNRLAHWMPLLRADALTGGGAGGKRVLRELADWIAACPPPCLPAGLAEARRDFDAPTPWRSLEAGIRLFTSWAEVVLHLGGDPRFLALAPALATAIAQHAEVLATVPPLLWPHADHNHYLMENLGLLAAAVLHPGMERAAAHAAHARRELARCALVQLTDDGGQIEGCPGYHNGSLGHICLALDLARRSGAALPAAVEARVRRAVEYTVHATRQDGRAVPWGDSDPAHTPLLAAGWWAAVSGDGVPFCDLAVLSGEAPARQAALDLLWEVAEPERLIELAARPSANPSRPRLHHQGQLGQVALRTSWSSDAAWVFAACRTPVNNGHAHIDPAGFEYGAAGRTLLVDPGRYTYRDGDDRIRIKSARWHNTLTLDGREPFAYRSTWAFGPQQPGTVTGAWDRPGLLAVAMEQRNWSPVLHRRLVALVDDALVVVDDLDGLAAGTLVERHCHCDSTAVQVLAPGACVQVGEVVLHLSSVGTVTLAEARVSTAIDCWHPSTVVTFSERVAGGRHCTALVAAPGAVPLPAAERQGAGIRCLFTLAGRPRCLVWSTAGATLEDLP